jgi:hypothetical protein
MFYVYPSLISIQLISLLTNPIEVHKVSKSLVGEASTPAKRLEIGLR